MNFSILNLCFEQQRLKIYYFDRVFDFSDFFDFLDFFSDLNKKKINFPPPPLYRSLSDYLRQKKFNDENDLRMDLVKFFGQKSRDFYEHGILSLPERWRQVVDNNGAYIVEN